MARAHFSPDGLKKRPIAKRAGCVGVGAMWALNSVLQRWLP
jgi:hypothetical protein